MRDDVWIVCGSRHLDSYSAVRSILDQAAGVRHGLPERLFEGGAKGADSFAREWALSFGVYNPTVTTFKADWATYGRAAGPNRNEEMAQAASTFERKLCIALPLVGAPNHGTANTVKFAMTYGIEVWARPVRTT